MYSGGKYYISEAEKERFITALTDQLATLRAKAGIAQEELSKLIGVSRQTYGAIERRHRRMTWGTYLSLILFFDYNELTHNAIRSLDAFPHKLIERFNRGKTTDLLPAIASADADFGDILERLDTRALQAINTVIMLEYARCTELPGEAVIRSFDGRRFDPTALTREATVQEALHQLKNKA